MVQSGGKNIYSLVDLPPLYIYLPSQVFICPHVWRYALLVFVDLLFFVC